MNLTIQHLSLNQGIETAIKLIHSGLGHIQNLDGANDFYHVPFLHLSSGFELLMKAIICLDHYGKKEAYPNNKKFFRSDLGHDLEKILEYILRTCFDKSYLKIQAAREDLLYLQSEELIKFVRILSRFGDSARYYHFDVVLGDKPKTDSPKDEWMCLETEILTETGKINDNEFLLSDQVYDFVAKEIVIKLERFARALTRLFTLGNLGKEAKIYTGYISGFLFLKDSDLGTRKYSLIGQIG